MPSPPHVETLAAVADWWVEVRCGCGRTALIPVRLLARAHGLRARLPALVARLRCSGCGARPADVALVDRPVDGRPGDVVPERRPVPGL